MNIACAMCMQQVVDVVHHWDAMAALVRKRVNWLMDNVPPSVRGWNVLAAFIVKRSMHCHCIQYTAALDICLSVSFSRLSHFMPQFTFRDCWNNCVYMKVFLCVNVAVWNTVYNRPTV